MSIYVGSSMTIDCAIKHFPSWQIYNLREGSRQETVTRRKEYLDLTPDYGEMLMFQKFNFIYD